MKFIILYIYHLPKYIGKLYQLDKLKIRYLNCVKYDIVSIISITMYQYIYSFFFTSLVF